MKTISAPLKQGILDGTVCTCVKVTRKDTQVKGFTNHDVTLQIGGVDYLPTPALERIVMNLRSNAEVSNQEFAAAFALDLNEDDLANGIYDEAQIEVFKVDWSNPSNGTVDVFNGQLGLVQWSEDGFRADIFNDMVKLERQIGVTVTPKCRHNLFGQISDTSVGACGLNAATFTSTGSISSVTTNQIAFVSSALSPTRADGYIENGLLTWTSGNNSGAVSHVKSYQSNTISLFLPTTFAMQVGDTFSVVAGCDKNFDTCKNKFSNAVNFGGFNTIRSEINVK